jgi:Fur family ferric uptake transcriptional regulator
MAEVSPPLRRGGQGEGGHRGRPPSNPWRLLEAAGVRPTAVRQAVLQRLLRSRRPLSQAELMEALRAGRRRFDRVTIYRTLATLKRVGLLHSVQGTDGIWRYATPAPTAPGCPGNHPHFLCLSCGRMLCLPGQSLPRVEVPEGAAVRGKQLVIYGYCPRCSGARRGTGSRPASSQGAT